MAASTNSYYGHNAILARYVGLRKPPPILGYLLHGWHSWFPWEPDAEDIVKTVPRGIPILVWRKVDERKLREAGAAKVIAIGSPFLYLLTVRGEAILPETRSLVTFPLHTQLSATVKDVWSEYTSYLESLDEFDRITVCLYPEDYERREVRSYFERGGFAIAMNGRRDDPHFLDRFYDLVSNHSEVTSNRITTALVYGAAMGRRAFLGGPVPGITVHETAGPIDDEGRQAARFQRENFPDLIDGVNSTAARGFGWSQLGGDCLRSPEELRRILGWSGPKRVAGHALGIAAEVRRRVKAL
jgi:hypothetical protein